MSFLVLFQLVCHVNDQNFCTVMHIYITEEEELYNESISDANILQQCRQVYP